LSRKNTTTFKMFAVSQPGLEHITAQELQALGISCTASQGGAEFSGGLHDLYTASLWLRSANRILVRVGSFRITELSEVAQRFARYPWELYGIGRESGITPRIRVTSHKSRLYHTGAVAERALSGIERRSGPFQIELDSPQEPYLVVIRIVRDRCTVSIDSSGQPLHMRGYRVKGVRAPLRENIAAALLLMSGWAPGMPLIDPFCGSGTIAIEAAMISSGIPPGQGRRFAFMNWKNFNADLWDRLLNQAAAERNLPAAGIYAADADIKAVRAASANAETAGVADFITLEHRIFSRDSACPPGPAGWIVTNPPYGRRVPARQRKKQDVYREIAQAMQRGFHTWGITCLVPSIRNNPLPGIRTETLTTFLNGGFRVRAVQYESLGAVQK